MAFQNIEYPDSPGWKPQLTCMPGMDNSPRSGYLSETLRGSDVSFIDLASQQALSAIYIARMARHLGQSGLANRFEEEFQQLKTLINRPSQFPRWADPEKKHLS